MIEASGVTVAFQFDEAARCLEKAKYPASNSATTIMTAFNIPTPD
jgi:hypothetical protein